MTHQPDPSDPVLAALADARRRRDQANHDIRLLLAYARELAQPRPYRLIDLASAARMSISGVRVAYTAEHVEQARQLVSKPALSLVLPAATAGGTQ